jgi:hypothetical protein
MLRNFKVKGWHGQTRLSVLNLMFKNFNLLQCSAGILPAYLIAGWKPAPLEGAAKKSLI